MKVLNKTLAWLDLALGAAFLQASRFLSLRNINPNLILILMVLLAVEPTAENAVKKMYSEKKNWSVWILMGITILAAAPVWFERWPALIILGILGTFMLLAKKKLTGDNLFDFLILIFLGTTGFYLLNAPAYLISEPMIIAAELFYNAVAGTLLILAARAFWRGSCLWI